LNVTIIGAGIVGYAVAYELASRGAAVRIVDPRGAGLGATRASAGMLAPYLEGHSPELLKLAVCGDASYDAFVARVQADAGRSIEYRRTGTLQVALNDEQAAALDDTARHLATIGVEHEVLDPPRMRALEPALVEQVSRGLLIRPHGYVVAGQLMSALVEALSRRGVDLTPSMVQGIARSGGRLRVTTSDDAFETDAVVIAAGSWSAGLTVPPVPVRPIRGQLLHVRFPQPPLTHIVWGTGCYLVPWTDGSVLIGATVEDVGFDEAATAEAKQQLLASASQLLPSVTSADLQEVRVGLRPHTPDELPVVGASSTMRGVYYATGHYRNGVLLAPITALMLADLMIDRRERPELALVGPARFGL
jgi:glycine oxidase